MRSDFSLNSRNQRICTLFGRAKIAKLQRAQGVDIYTDAMVSDR